MSKNRQSVVASVSDAGKGKSKKKQPAGAGLSFYDLAANVPGVVYQFQIEPDGKRSLPYVSPTVYDYLGLRPEEVMADVEKWFAITHPDDLPALESSIKESLHNMAQWHWQGRFLKNGTDTVWFRGSSNPRKLEDGSVLWNGVFVDVTQQRQAEDSLRRSHEKLEDLISKRTEQLLEKTRQYQILIENAADGIFIHDEEGRIVECNKHIMDSMGYSEQEIKGLTIFDINPNLDKEKVIMALRSDIAGEERLFETHHKCKDGTIFPVEIKRAGYERDGNRYFVAVVRDVSKRHEIEQKLADQEEKYRSLFELSDDANMTLDRESFLDCNQATLDMFGYATKEEFLGKHPSEISPPCQPDGTDSRAAADKHIADAYSKQKDFFEWMHRRANGENFPAEVLLKPMKLEGREVLQAIVRDITERKRAELALVESEARFREMADQAPALIWMADTENKGVWYNRRWLDYTGRAMGQELGFGWIDGMHHDDRERCASFCQSAFDQKEQFDMEFRLRRADGSYGWIADTGIPRFDRDGKFIGYIGYCWDITDRKRAQFALSDSEARFRTLSMHAPVGIYLTDVEGKCVYVNDKWQEMTGLSEQQAFGEGWAGALHPEDREAVFLEWKRFAKESDEFSMEYRFSKPDGEVTWVSGKAIALRDTEDNFIGYLGSITDITERKAVEEKLVAAKREADAANNAKSEFLSRMSHELRTPLNAILGFGQLLQIDARILNEEQRVAITHIMEGGKHLLHLINEVLDIAAVDAGEIKLSCE
ncbi:MAG: PAS domain S-box protein, partial [Gammaproteobacteria bacterium]|nr:PAS domain S-box protein [Gammaproteobacteria bacterium]